MSVFTFLLLLTPLALVITAFIVWPLLRQRPPARVGPAGAGGAGGSVASADGRTGGADSAPGPADRIDRQAATNRAVVAERRAQLDEEIAGLAADSPERARRIAEFTRQALSDLEAPAPAPAPARPRLRTGLIISLLTVLLVLPLIGYRLIGTPEWPGIVNSSQTEVAEIRNLVTEVERRLAERPDDAQGWLLLGRTRLALGETAAGLSALERALAVERGDGPLGAQIRTDLADALARSGEPDLGGRPTALVREALALDPGHPKALALAGAFAAGAGNLPEARRHWQALLAELPAGSEQADQVRQMIDQLGQAGTDQARSAKSDSAKTAATAPVAAQGPRLTGQVSLAPDLASEARPDDTVFIVARGLGAGNEPSGPPVAVVRIRVADLPYAFSLDDAAAMTPAATLSRQSKVRIVARISRSGSAMPAPGDIEGRSDPVANDASNVTVQLNHLLP